MIFKKLLLVPILVLAICASCDSLNGGSTGGDSASDWGTYYEEEIIEGSTTPLTSPPSFNPSCSSEPTGPASATTLLAPNNDYLNFPNKIVVDGYGRALVIDQELYVLKVNETSASVSSGPAGTYYCMPSDVAVTKLGSYVIAYSRIVKTTREIADYRDSSPLFKLASAEVELTESIIERLTAQGGTNCEAGVSIYNTQAKESEILVEGSPLINPTGMEINSEGKIILVDAGLEKVLEIDFSDSDDVTIRTIQDDEIFASALGLTVGADDLIYTIHNGKKLVRIDPQSRDLTILHEGPPFLVPAGITRDCLDQLIIADAMADSVYNYNPASGELELISGSPSFVSPMDVAVDMDNNLLVIDQSNALFRISR